MLCVTHVILRVGSGKSSWEKEGDMSLQPVMGHCHSTSVPPKPDGHSYDGGHSQICFPFPLMMEDSSWGMGRMSGRGKVVSSQRVSICYEIDYLEKGESVKCL